MTDYRITCTNQTGCTTGGHITSVGTGGDAGWDRQWTVQDVYNAMNRGDRFFTFGGGAWATVNPYRCGCGLGTLRSGADATTANNLDSLVLCRFSA
jgi:uncharacterized protein DUF3892